MYGAKRVDKIADSKRHQTEIRVLQPCTIAVQKLVFHSVLYSKWHIKCAQAASLVTWPSSHPDQIPIVSLYVCLTHPPPLFTPDHSSTWHYPTPYAHNTKPLWLVTSKEQLKTHTPLTPFPHSQNVITLPCPLWCVNCQLAMFYKNNSKQSCMPILLLFNRAKRLRIQNDRSHVKSMNFPLSQKG